MRVPVDATDSHVYAAEWTPGAVHFSVDGDAVKTVGQSPAYPLQLMGGIYEFPREPGDESAGGYPKEFVVDYVRGYRLVAPS